MGGIHARTGAAGYVGDRVDLGKVIERRLVEERDRINDQWSRSSPINHFVIDDLLPLTIAERVRAAFPRPESMTLKRSLRELKYISAQMDRYDPILEEAIYAFQQPGVVEAIRAFVGLAILEPDERLYAGGISMMGPGHFLNPHLDNSHDKDRERYRVLNLLYYVSPGWSARHGGNLELWPNGPADEPMTIVSQFNRLVVMVTHKHSWHSVSKNVSGEARCCLSNYYFSPESVSAGDYFHPTSFRGRPEEPIRDAVLQLDAATRGMARKLFPKGVRKAAHVYEKK